MQKKGRMPWMGEEILTLTRAEANAGLPILSLFAAGLFMLVLWVVVFGVFGLVSLLPGVPLLYTAHSVWPFWVSFWTALTAWLGVNGYVKYHRLTNRHTGIPPRRAEKLHDFYSLPADLRASVPELADYLSEWDDPTYYGSKAHDWHAGDPKVFEAFTALLKEQARRERILSRADERQAEASREHALFRDRLQREVEIVRLTNQELSSEAVVPDKVSAGIDTDHGRW